MPVIMNYTTQIEADKTLGEITAMLMRAGARSIGTDFSEDGRVGAMTFTIKTPYGMRSFRMPVESKRVLAVLQKNAQPKYRTIEQAERVAWRIVKDWLEAQLALVQLSLISIDQAMLGFMQIRDGRPETAYQLYASEQLALPEKT